MPGHLQVLALPAAAAAQVEALPAAPAPCEKASGPALKPAALLLVPSPPHGLAPAQQLLLLELHPHLIHLHVAAQAQHQAGQLGPWSHLCWGPRGVTGVTGLAQG
jgi:hypothetical protein